MVLPYFRMHRTGVDRPCCHRQCLRLLGGYSHVLHGIRIKFSFAFSTAKEKRASHVRRLVCGMVCHRHSTHRVFQTCGIVFARVNCLLRYCLSVLMVVIMCMRVFVVCMCGHDFFTRSNSHFFSLRRMTVVCLGPVAGCKSWLTELRKKSWSLLSILRILFSELRSHFSLLRNSQTSVHEQQNREHSKGQ